MLMQNSCKTISCHVSRTCRRAYAQSNLMKVALIGANNDIGRPLSLLLKQSPLIDELVVYDSDNICGYATELGHIDTKCKVLSYKGIENIGTVLKDAKVVGILPPSERHSLITQSKLLDCTGFIVRDLMHKIADHCTKALLAIAVPPINSTVPLACEILKDRGMLQPNAVFGITSLDGVRSNAFGGKILGVEPECIFVPVIGGNSDKTIVPVYSQATPYSDFTKDELEILTTKVQNAHNDIIQIKKREAATVSWAFAINRFLISLVKAQLCHPNIVECAYVMSNKHPNVKYLATPLLLGSRGIERNLGIPRLTEYEICLFNNAICHLAHDIKQGELFYRNNSL